MATCTALLVNTTIARHELYIKESASTNDIFIRFSTAQSNFAQISYSVSEILQSYCLCYDDHNDGDYGDRDDDKGWRLYGTSDRHDGADDGATSFVCNSRLSHLPFFPLIALVNEL